MMVYEGEEEQNEGRGSEQEKNGGGVGDLASWREPLTTSLARGLSRILFAPQVMQLLRRGRLRTFVCVAPGR